MTFVFYSQYVNTGLMLLLTNANFENTPLSFIPLRNRFADYSEDWYILVGSQQVQTMMINSIMPYMNFFILRGLSVALQFLDSRTTLFQEKPLTRTKTIQEYVLLYAGPEVEIHYRYSGILNIVFSTFTHGLALPILFPIAAFSMFNFYICEKYLFAYFYRKPPLFDNKMNERALTLLAYAPAFLLAFGYWQLGNRQAFFNESGIRTQTSQVLDPKHRVFEYAEGVNVTLLYLAFFIAVMFHSRAARCLQRVARCCRCYKQLKDFDDDWTYTKDVNE